MNMKYLIWMPLSVVIWSGYVMFDMFNYYFNGGDFHAILGFIGIPIFAVLGWFCWHEKYLIFEDEK